jgi:hypothetical protein
VFNFNPNHKKYAKLPYEIACKRPMNLASKGHLELHHHMQGKTTSKIRDIENVSTMKLSNHQA